MGKSKRARRYAFLAYDTWNGHSGTNTDYGPVFKRDWQDAWKDKYNIE
jgi:hypothetical protein